MGKVLKTLAKVIKKTPKRAPATKVPEGMTVTKLPTRKAGAKADVWEQPKGKGRPALIGKGSVTLRKKNKAAAVDEYKSAPTVAKIKAAQKLITDSKSMKASDLTDAQKKAIAAAKKLIKESDYVEPFKVGGKISKKECGGKVMKTLGGTVTNTKQTKGWGKARTAKKGK